MLINNNSIIIVIFSIILIIFIVCNSFNKKNKIIEMHTPLNPVIMSNDLNNDSYSSSTPDIFLNNKNAASTLSSRPISSNMDLGAGAGKDCCHQT